MSDTEKKQLDVDPNAMAAIGEALIGDLLQLLFPRDPRTPGVVAELRGSSRRRLDEVVYRSVSARYNATQDGAVEKDDIDQDGDEEHVG